MSVDLALKNFGRVVVKESKTALTKQKRNVSKDLYNSIRFESKVSKNSFELSFFMEDHGKFLDKGVNGFKSSRVENKDSPYRFGKSAGKGKVKGGLSDSINKWVKARRFQFRNLKTGKFMSYDSTAFIISKSIYLKGTPATKFFEKPFNAAFKKLPNEIVKAYGLKVENLFKNVLA